MGAPPGTNRRQEFLILAGAYGKIPLKRPTKGLLISATPNAVCAGGQTPRLQTPEGKHHGKLDLILLVPS
jgi:hypothetical protein